MLNLAWRLNNFIESAIGVRIEKKSRTFVGVRALLLDKLNPELAIDVGANIGQWGRDFKNRCPDIPLISFEPNIQLSSELDKATRQFRNWTYRVKALGAETGQAELNITSDNGLSSSINIRAAHNHRHPHIDSVGQMNIAMSTLDDEIDTTQAQRIFLKIDAQGYENEVLSGGKFFLDSVVLIEMETSFSPLYEDESAHHHLVSRLMNQGFTPWCTSIPEQGDDGRFWSCDILLVRSTCISIMEL